MTCRLLQGRDCNAKLQRSIKATKLRSAIPSLIARCRDRLDAWQLAEGEPFLYDGAPYLVSKAASLLLPGVPASPTSLVATADIDGRCTSHEGNNFLVALEQYQPFDITITVAPAMQCSLTTHCARWFQPVQVGQFDRQDATHNKSLSCPTCSTLAGAVLPAGVSRGCAG